MKEGILVLFVEKELVTILSTVSFSSFGCINVVVVLKVGLKQTRSLSVSPVHRECVTAEESVVVNCDGQSFDIVAKFCYLGDTIGARGSVEDSVTARIKSGWNKFREL